MEDVAETIFFCARQMSALRNWPEINITPLMGCNKGRRRPLGSPDPDAHGPGSLAAQMAWGVFAKQEGRTEQREKPGGE